MNIFKYNGMVILEENGKKEIISICKDYIHIREYEALDYKSYAVIKKDKLIDFEIKNNSIFYLNKRIDIKSNFLLDIYENDILVLSDIIVKKDFDNDDNGLLALEGHKVLDNDNYKYFKGIKLNENDYIYGLGDKTGFINKRGYEYINWNTDDPSPQVDNFKSLYKSIPFFIVKGTKNYGIFVDNTYKTIFDFGKNKNDELVFASTDGYLNYYIFFGSMKDIIKSYTNLTGRTPMPLRWSLGYHQSRWSYSSKEEVLSLVDNFNKYNIPLECIHLDIDYMDEYKVFTVSNERFNDFKNMILELNKKGIKIVTIIDPGVKAKEGYFVYDEGIKNGYFAIKDNKVYHNAVWPGDSVFPQFTDSNVRKWWGDLTKIITDYGVSGIWNDMNEPASFNGPIELDVLFKDGNDYKTHKEIHNVYGHLMAEATYLGIKKNTNKRPFIITRACYSGSQRYTTVWTGDNHSIWAHLEMAIPQQCNLGISGIPFVGTDIGGFGSDCTKELLIRWIEVGIFSPLCRNHSAYKTKRQEPWEFDDEVIDIYRKFVNLRYKLIPYIYDLFYKHQTNGLPIIRPLVLEYENDYKCFSINDEFMLGDSILVAPQVKNGAFERIVYLPKGKWIDFNTNKIYYGGKSYIYETPLDICPMFIKFNSIIPILNDTNIDDIRNISFYCYGNKGKYLHYQDNGIDFNYLNKEYNLYEIEFNEDYNIKLKYNGFKKYDNISINIIRGNKK